MNKEKPIAHVMGFSDLIKQMLLDSQNLFKTTGLEIKEE